MEEAAVIIAGALMGVRDPKKRSSTTWRALLASCCVHVLAAAVLVPLLPWDKPAPSDGQILAVTVTIEAPDLLEPQPEAPAPPVLLPATESPLTAPTPPAVAETVAPPSSNAVPPASPPRPKKRRLAADPVTVANRHQETTGPSAHPPLPAIVSAAPTDPAGDADFAKAGEEPLNTPIATGIGKDLAQSTLNATPARNAASLSPVCQVCPKPVYPPRARQRGIEGVVIVMARLGAGGGVEEVQVKNTSGHALLDQSALTAVRGWQFLPQPAASAATPDPWIQIPVRFALN